MVKGKDIGREIRIGSLILEDEIAQIEEKMRREAVKAIMGIFVAEKIEEFSKSLQGKIKALGLKDKDAMHLALAVGLLILSLEAISE